MKERLNLTLDKDVVHKAKVLGINISEFTENILAAYIAASSPEGGNPTNQGYQELFNSLLPLLKKFDIQVKIAEGTDKVTYEDEDGTEHAYNVDVEIILRADGSFYISEYDTYFKDIKKIAPRHFLRPVRILKNLTDALSRNEEIRKEKMNEIMMAQNIVEAMYKTLVKKPSK